MAVYPCAHTLTINGKKKTFANSAEFKKYLSEGGLKELNDAKLVNDKFHIDNVGNEKFTAKGGNKVVNEKTGEPLEVYHGTNMPFESFDKGKLGDRNAFAESALEGFFFAGDKATSENYTGATSLDFAMPSDSDNALFDKIKNKYKEEIDSAKEQIDNVKNKYRNERINNLTKELGEQITNTLNSDKFKSLSDDKKDNFINALSTLSKTDNNYLEKANEKNESNGNNKKLKDILEKSGKEFESEYLKSKGKEKRILSANISIKNPFVFDYEGIERSAESFAKQIKDAKESGHDGVIFKNVKDGAEKDTIYVVFDNEQIKIKSKNVLESENAPKPKSEQPIKEEKNIPEKKVEDFTDEEMQKAYDEQAKELKKLRGADYKFQILHDEGLQMTRDDFNHYGDRNLAKGDRKFEKYFSSKALPLDKKLKSLSDQYEIEITPQDAIDYILDKNDNPLKYRESTSKTLGRNAKIPIKLADTINNLGIKTEADVEALRGFPLDDAEANLIIDYLKNNKNEKENITNESAKPSGSEDRPTTKEGEGLEGKTAKEKVTVTPPEAPKEIVEPPKKEISEVAKKIADLDAKIADKKKVISEKLKKSRGELGLNKLPIEVIPDLVDLAKLYLEKYGRQFGEFIKGFREEHPEFADVADSEIKSELFDKVVEGEGVNETPIEKLDNIKITQSDEIEKYISGETIEDVFGDSPEGDQSYFVTKVADMLADGEAIIETGKNVFGDDVISYGTGLLNYFKGLKSQNDTVKKSVGLASLIGNLQEQKIKNPERSAEINNLLQATEREWQTFIHNPAVALNAGRILRLWRDKNIGSELADKLLDKNTSKRKKKINEIENTKKITDDVAEKGVTRKREPVKKTEKPTAKKQEKKVVKKSDVYRKKADAILKENGGKNPMLDKIKDMIKKIDC